MVYVNHFYDVKRGKVVRNEFNISYLKRTLLWCWWWQSILASWRGHGHADRGESWKSLSSSKGGKCYFVVDVKLWCVDKLRKWCKKGTNPITWRGILKRGTGERGKGEYICYHQKRRKSYIRSDVKFWWLNKHRDVTRDKN